MIETTNKMLYKVYYYYHKVSVWIVPIAFVCFYISLAILYAVVHQLTVNSEPTKADTLVDKTFKVNKALGYITTITNVLSCFILFMTVRHAYKLTQN